MTREQIEKAAKGKAEELRMSANSVRTDIDVQNIFQIGFMDGARWLADHLCRIPWDDALNELHEYVREKQENIYKED